jgi:hypothetical protein
MASQQKKTKENSNQINIQQKIERNTSFKRPKERAKTLKRPYPSPAADPLSSLKRKEI